MMAPDGAASVCIPISFALAASLWCGGMLAGSQIVLHPSASQMVLHDVGSIGVVFPLSASALLWWCLWLPDVVLQAR